MRCTRGRCDDPEAFWAAGAEDIHWERRWDRVLDDSRPPFYRWFAGGVLNTCYNAARPPRRRAAAASRRRSIYDCPVTGTVRDVHLRRAARRGRALRRRAAPAWASSKGDRVIIYMPMVPEAVIAMLACARLGAIHSVVFGGFASKELATRIDDAKPTRDRSRRPAASRPAASSPTSRCSTARSTLAAHKPRRCVILQRPQERARRARAGPRPRLGRGGGGGRAGRLRAGGRHRPALHPLHLGHHRHAQGRGARQRRPRGRAQVERCDAVYGMGAGEVFWAASDIGWVVGHSYIVYAPAAARLHHHPLRGQAGGHARPGRVLARLAAARRERALHRADRVPRDQEGRPGRRATCRARPLALPHAVPRRRALRSRHAATGPREQLQRAGDRPLVADRDRLAHRRQLRRHRACCRSSRARRRKAVPGYDVRVLDARTNQEMPAGQIGSIAIKLPLPPGCLPTLWHNDERLREVVSGKHPGLLPDRRRRLSTTTTAISTS